MYTRRGRRPGFTAGVDCNSDDCCREEEGEYHSDGGRTSPSSVPMSGVGALARSLCNGLEIVGPTE